MIARYVGPEPLMPLASLIAAGVGFLLMFWRRTMAFARSIGHTIAGLFGTW